VRAPDESLTLINAGTSSVEVDALDEVAQLQLSITIELTVGGLIRARAEVTNTGEDPYAVASIA
jgi:alpha-galactosidase